MRKLHQRVFGKWNRSFEVWFRIAWKVKVCDIWDQMVRVQLPTSVITASVWASSIFLSLFCYKAELYNMEDSEHPMILPSSDNFETNCSPLIEMLLTRQEIIAWPRVTFPIRTPIIYQCLICVCYVVSCPTKNMKHSASYLCNPLLPASRYLH